METYTNVPVMENFSPSKISTTYFIPPFFPTICNNHCNAKTENVREHLLQIGN
jgi:hypothetical protein